MAILLYSSELRMAIADDPQFLSDESALSSMDHDGTPIILQDWETYFVKFYGETEPPFFPEPGRYYNQRKFPGRLFEVSFRNAVGMTRIGPIPILVVSRKITDTVYAAMLDYIAGKYANLVFSFENPLGQQYCKDRPGQDIAYVEYLFLKKYLLDGSPNIDSIAALILANPHRRLYREYRRNSIDAITSIPPAMLVNMFSSPDRFAVLKPDHPLVSTACGRAIFNRTGRRLFPAEAMEERKHYTVDTNENRFMKHFLQSVQRRLQGLAKALKGKSGGYLNPDIEASLEKMDRGLMFFLSDPFWSDVGTMRFIPAGSQVLQRRDGYRQLFRLYSLLQLATHCHFNNDDFQNLLETKDTPTLFEYWSFFVVKDVLDKINKIRSCRTVVSTDPLEQKIIQGICIEYEGGIFLWFNRISPGSPGFMPFENPRNTVPNESYSHNLRPDIVISRGNNILIFDAKFKGQRDSFYGDERGDGTIGKWREEDIDKMHTYREAIRNVSGAYILYPGEEAAIYSAHNSTGIYEGVGALPLKPEAGARPVQRHLEGIEKIVKEFIAV
ncbi:MAG: hypothetical protein FD159_492 [Syntrophaceae bacterium]|nr:MAG: hypothetical protein FD159_492 [Syntrophaceae bacterium]